MRDLIETAANLIHEAGALFVIGGSLAIILLGADVLAGVVR